MATADPLMRTLSQVSPPQIAPAVRAAGENADNITATESNGEGRFIGTVRSQFRTERNAPIEKNTVNPEKFHGGASACRSLAFFDCLLEGHDENGLSRVVRDLEPAVAVWHLSSSHSSRAIS
jgi:hypothetical protein